MENLKIKCNHSRVFQIVLRGRAKFPSQWENGIFLPGGFIGFWEFDEE